MLSPCNDQWFKVVYPHLETTIESGILIIRFLSAIELNDESWFPLLELVKGSRITLEQRKWRLGSLGSPAALEKVRKLKGKV